MNIDCSQPHNVMLLLETKKERQEKIPKNGCEK
jgi:hypothetical protein